MFTTTTDTNQKQSINPNPINTTNDGINILNKARIIVIIIINYLNIIIM